MVGSLVSVIVPVYNTKDYLERCLDSILLQTYKNTEVILVDDGSTDGSGEICDRYAKIDSRIRVIHKENGGVSKARNVALEKVSGEYVCFIDSDDTVDENLILHLYTTMEKKNADLIICSFKTVHGNIISENRVVFDSIEYSQEEALKDILLLKTFTGSPWGKLFKTDRIKNLYFDDDIFFAEDLLFVIKAIMKSEKIVFTPESYYNYYDRENSGWKNQFDAKTFTDHIARERIIDCVSKTNKEHLIELSNANLMLCDINLLAKLYYDKGSREQYCERLQKSIREHFSFERIKQVSLFQKIGIIAAAISIRLYFMLFSVQVKMKKTGEKNGK